MKTIPIFLNPLFLFSCQPRQGTEYLEAVEGYANALLNQARDTYGSEHSPLMDSNG